MSNPWITCTRSKKFLILIMVEGRSVLQDDCGHAMWCYSSPCCCSIWLSTK
uniref:Uncharacterized protein n=1 Tax=Rhizophora mucronata TaxID=61149 RepID=A0A2P2NJE0_RHIMU